MIMTPNHFDFTGLNIFDQCKLEVTVFLDLGLTVAVLS